MFATKQEYSHSVVPGSGHEGPIEIAELQLGAHISLALGLLHGMRGRFGVAEDELRDSLAKFEALDKMDSSGIYLPETFQSRFEWLSANSKSVALLQLAVTLWQAYELRSGLQSLKAAYSNVEEELYDEQREL